jgi:hypothetical protein
MLPFLLESWNEGSDPSDAGKGRARQAEKPGLRRTGSTGVAGAYAPLVDAIAEYRAASEANDLDRLVATLAPDAELVSPLLARGVIRGKKDLGLLFAAVYGSLSELRWTEQIIDGDQGFMIAKARIGPFRIDDAMVFELDRDGRIQRIRPHLRPWLASTWFALAVGAKVARHPGFLWRALSTG